MSVQVQLDFTQPRSLVMGEFNSEEYWRCPNLAKLPEIPDRSSQGVVLAMDELLFLFCTASDLLITRFKFNSALKNYLNSLGFNFSVNSRSIQQNPAERESSVFQIIADHPERLRDLQREFQKPRQFHPYSLTPGCNILAQVLNVDFSGPDLKVVKEVNSKVYSCRLCGELGLKRGGEVVVSARELLKKGEALLRKGAFLIKDPYGVSGKGNLLVRSGPTLKRLVKYLETQERNGLTCLFVLESFLNKAKDFSCALTIAENGDIEVVSVQEMVNRNFAYGGSYTADPAFVDELCRKEYFEALLAIAGKLYTDGYFGPVCVDSMVLQSGELVPLVEVNARKSMGLLNHRVDRYLARDGLKGNLIFLNLGCRAGLSFEQVLEELDTAGVLFNPGMDRGVLVLSANTLLANQEFFEPAASDTPQALAQGRIYLSVIAADHEGRQSLVRAVRSVFQGMSWIVYN
jgi:hypothetical protein